MFILKQSITDFISSNVTETVDEYSASYTYALGEEARDGAYIYKSVIADNLGNKPEDTLDMLWVKIGVSNKYAMLDLRANTKSTKTGDNLVVEFAQNMSDTLALGNYSASSVLIEIFDEYDVEIWSYETPETLNEGVVDWWTWTYNDYGYEYNKALMVPLGRTDGAKVRVTFNYSSVLGSTASCGYLISGIAQYMGETLYGVNFKFNSFATKEFDAFGTLSVLKRGVQDIVDFNTVIQHTEKGLMTTKREIKEVYDDVIAFILDTSETSQYENMITLGTIQDANVVLNNGTVYNIAWSVIEVI